ncbi:MAG: hypothetical protein ABI175_25485, partial [Polyangiales bacterium]
KEAREKKEAEEKTLAQKAKAAAEKIIKELQEKLEKDALKKAKEAAKKYLKEQAAEIGEAIARQIVVTVLPALPFIPGALLGTAQDMVETELEKEILEAIHRGDIAEHKRLTDLHGKPPGDVGPQLRKQKACTDPMRCGNQCSSLGAQVSKATACSQGFVDEVMRRTGMAPRSVPPARDLGRVSKPRPDAIAPGDDATGVCVSGAAVVRTGISACGAILCTGTIAAGTASACCGGALSNASLTRAADCYGMNCGDQPTVVNPTTGVCGCEQPAPVAPPPDNPFGPPKPPL